VFSATIGAALSSYVTAHHSVALRAVSPILPERRLAQILAGEKQMEDVAREAREISVRSGPEAARAFLRVEPEAYHWENQRICRILRESPYIRQVVVMHCRMDSRAYELPCLSRVDVVEVEEKAIVQVKESLIQSKGGHIPMLARSMRRVTSADEVDFSFPSLIVSTSPVDETHLVTGSALVCCCSTDCLFDAKGFGDVALREKSPALMQMACWDYFRCT
jgi:hypothetical protein